MPRGRLEAQKAQREELGKRWEREMRKRWRFLFRSLFVKVRWPWLPGERNKACVWLRGGSARAFGGGGRTHQIVQPSSRVTRQKTRQKVGYFPDEITAVFVSQPLCLFLVAPVVPSPRLAAAGSSVARARRAPPAAFFCRRQRREYSRDRRRRRACRPLIGERARPHYAEALLC